MHSSSRDFLSAALIMILNQSQPLTHKKTKKHYQQMAQNYRIKKQSAGKSKRWRIEGGKLPQKQESKGMHEACTRLSQRKTIN